MSVTLTVFFDGTFFAALVERREGTQLRAAKHVFGPEPSDPEVLNWVLQDFAKLKLSPGVEAPRAVRATSNPKRRQRQAAKVVSSEIGARSQQALQLARELSAEARRQQSRAQSEADAERKYQLRREKQKAKHRGH